MQSPAFFQARRAACAVALVLALPAAMAWTDKPVKLLVPAPAGGTIDVVARIVADQLAQEIGQPVIVDNRPGAGGAIAVKAMISAPADGQTIMMTASNVLSEIPHVLKGGFDPLKDVRPVALLSRSVMVLVGAPNFPPKDLKSLIAYVKANPGKISFASYSAGTASHYAGMILNQKAGLDMQHVPFAGSAPALAQIMAGQISVMFDGMATSKPLIGAGKVQIYGVAVRTRSSHLPQVPTLAEQGFPDLDFGNWVGVVASAAMSPDLVEKMHRTLTKVAAAPKVRERLVLAGFEPAPESSTTQIAQDLRAEFERNAAIVKAFDIRLNR